MLHTSADTKWKPVRCLWKVHRLRTQFFADRIFRIKHDRVETQKKHETQRRHLWKILSSVSSTHTEIRRRLVTPRSSRAYSNHVKLESKRHGHWSRVQKRWCILCSSVKVQKVHRTDPHSVMEHSEYVLRTLSPEWTVGIICCHDKLRLCETRRKENNARCIHMFTNV